MIVRASHAAQTSQSQGPNGRRCVAYVRACSSCRDSMRSSGTLSVYLGTDGPLVIQLAVGRRAAAVVAQAHGVGQLSQRARCESVFGLGGDGPPDGRVGLVILADVGETLGPVVLDCMRHGATPHYSPADTASMVHRVRPVNKVALQMRIFPAGLTARGTIPRK